MVARSMAYRVSDQVEPSSLGTEDYFTARLLVARAQEYPDEDGKSVYSLDFAHLEQDKVLPHDLRYSFTDKDGSFKGRMGVVLTKQLRGRPVVAIFRRSDKGIEAIIPFSQDL